MKKVLFFAIGLLLLASCSGDKKDMPEYDLLPVSTDGHNWGYVNKDGLYAVSPQFKQAGLFYDGLARIQMQDDAFGYVNDKGVLAFANTYADATHFANGLAFVVNNFEAPKAINTKGEVMFELTNAAFAYAYSEGLAKYCQMEDGELRFGFVDTHGESVIAPIFADAQNFSEGLCAVYNGDKWGYIDTKGNLVINDMYDYAKDFHNGLAVVSQSNRYGVINKKAIFQINPQYSFMQHDGDYFMIASGSRWMFGWCDEKGMIRINPQYAEAQGYNGSGLAPVKMGRTFGYIDDKGMNVIQARFDEANPFLPNGLAPVVFHGVYGFIDNKGIQVINNQFRQVGEELKMPTDNLDFISSYVGSDYADMTALFELINPSNPAGLNFADTVTFKMVNTLFGKTKDNYKAGEETLVMEKTLSQSLQCELRVLGNPFANEAYYTTETYGVYYRQQERVRHTKQTYKEDLCITGVRFDISHNQIDMERSQKIADMIRATYPEIETSVTPACVSVTIPAKQNSPAAGTETATK